MCHISGFICSGSICSDRTSGLVYLESNHFVIHFSSALHFRTYISFIIGTDVLGSVLPHTLDMKNDLLFTEGGVSLQLRNDALSGRVFNQSATRPPTPARPAETSVAPRQSEGFLGTRDCLRHHIDPRTTMTTRLLMTFIQVTRLYDVNL